MTRYYLEKKLDDVLKCLLLEEFAIQVEELNYQVTCDLEEKYVGNVIYVCRRYEITIQELKIPNGYQHIDYNEDGSKRVTTTWNWM